jgi:hypothetical protein
MRVVVFHGDAMFPSAGCQVHLPHPLSRSALVLLTENLPAQHAALPIRRTAPRTAYNHLGAWRAVDSPGAPQED